MRKLRPLASLLMAASVGGAVFCASFWMASRLRQASTASQADELAWVCREFQLSPAEIDRLRALHNGYKPKCLAMCARIDARNRDLAGLLATATNVGPEIERALGDIASLRAECQAQMLRHFQEVARTMPGDRGERYLTEMYRLTLGFHSLEDAAVGHSAAHESR